MFRWQCTGCKQPYLRAASEVELLRRGLFKFRLKGERIAEVWPSKVMLGHFRLPSRGVLGANKRGACSSGVFGTRVRLG